MNPQEPVDPSVIPPSAPATQSRVPDAVPIAPAWKPFEDRGRPIDEIKVASVAARIPEEIPPLRPTGTKIVKAATIALLFSLWCVLSASASFYYPNVTNDTAALLTAQDYAWNPNGTIILGQTNILVPGTLTQLNPRLGNSGGGVTWPVGIAIFNGTNTYALLVPFVNETNPLAGINAASDLYQVGYLENSNNLLAFVNFTNDLSIPLNAGYFTYQSDGRPILSGISNVSAGASALLIPASLPGGLVVAHGLNATAIAVNYASISNYFGSTVAASWLFNNGYTVNTNSWSSGSVQPVGTTGVTVTQIYSAAIPFPVQVYGGTNAPNGLYTAGVGSMFNLFDGTGTNLLGQYIKSTATGNTGWVLSSLGGGTNSASTNGLATIQYVQNATNTLAAPALSGIVPQASIPPAFQISGLNFSNVIDLSLTPVVETNSGLTIGGAVRAPTFQGSGLLTNSTLFGLNNTISSSLLSSILGFAQYYSGSWSTNYIKSFSGGLMTINDQFGNLVSLTASNVTASGVFTGNGANITNLNSSIVSAGANVTVTPTTNATTAVVTYTVASTGGGSSTNGLATTNYVNAITNGLATTAYALAATNGLATIAYVNSATNGLGTNVVNQWASGTQFANSVVVSNTITVSNLTVNLLGSTNGTGTNVFGGTINASAVNSTNAYGTNTFAGVLNVSSNLTVLGAVAAPNLIIATGGMLNNTNLPATITNALAGSAANLTNCFHGWTNGAITLIQGGSWTFPAAGLLCLTTSATNQPLVVSNATSGIVLQLAGPIGTNTVTVTVPGNSGDVVWLTNTAAGGGANTNYERFVGFHP